MQRSIFHSMHVFEYMYFYFQIGNGHPKLNELQMPFRAVGRLKICLSIAELLMFTTMTYMAMIIAWNRVWRGKKYVGKWLSFLSYLGMLEKLQNFAFRTSTLPHARNLGIELQFLCHFQIRYLLYPVSIT